MKFSSSVLGNHFLELEPKNYQAKQVSQELDKQSDLLQFSWTDDIDCDIVDLEEMFWILYFVEEYTNKTTGNEAPGMKRAIELKIKDLKVFGNFGAKPFQQEIIEAHPKLEPLIQKELRKHGSVLK